MPNTLTGKSAAAYCGLLKEIFNKINKKAVADYRDKVIGLINEKTKRLKGNKSLTPREYEILTYVITGMLNKQIAYDLDISEKTVKVHRGRVMEKLGIDSVAELVRLAEKAGIEPAEVPDL